MTEQVWVSPGTLYIVATPIGNLSDLTERATKTLQQADLICCEDTRHTARLMDAIGSRRPLMSLHEHNESEKADSIVNQLKEGKSIALVSDAGTPLISDPGYVLVNAVVDAGLKVVPVPGVSAVISALSVAGLPTDHWSFEGFLPAKAMARQKALSALSECTHTMVFYESSHRIESSLKDMAVAFGEARKAVVARELTKTFETFLRGTFSEIVQLVATDANQRKGEFVVIVGGAPRNLEPIVDAQIAALALHLKPLLPPKKAAAVMVDVFGGNKKKYYEYLLTLN